MIMRNLKRLLYIITAGLVIAIVAGYVQAAPEKKQTVTAKKIEVTAKKQPKEIKKPKEAKEVKKPFDPNRKVPTLKKKYRKE